MFGAPPETVAQWAAWEEEERPRAEFPVLPESWPAIELFALAATQWRYAGGRPVGLDYGAIEAAARLLGHALTPEAFAGLRTMERAILAAWAEGQ
jgi:hypothetical protein